MLRRDLLAAGLAAPILSLSQVARSAPLSAIAPAEAGFVGDIEARIVAAVKTGELAGLHGLVVLRSGKIALERYFSGVDERLGQPLGQVDFTSATLHDLRSVSKSIVGLLYGIALAEGKAPALDTPLLELFRYPDLAADPKRRALTVAHALSMTLGTDWNEDVPYTSTANSELAMEAAADRYRFVLERPFVAEPGTRWIYNGGATALIGALISRGTGVQLHEYARQTLFAPLGIVDSEWSLGSNGEPAAASGLRLRPQDLAKIGQLVLDGGIAGGKQIVGKAWLEALFEKRAAISPERGDFGYHWYLGSLRGSGKPWMGAFGNGGQRLIVIPSLAMAVAITAGNYNREDQWKMPVALLGKYILGSLNG